MTARRIEFPAAAVVPEDRAVFGLEELAVGAVLAFHSDRDPGRVVRREVVALTRAGRLVRRRGAAAEHRSDVVIFDDGHSIAAGYAVMSTQWRLAGEG
jgi:hypothetical protein